MKFSSWDVIFISYLIFLRTYCSVLTSVITQDNFAKIVAVAHLFPIVSSPGPPSCIGWIAADVLLLWAYVLCLPPRLLFMPWFLVGTNLYIFGLYQIALGECGIMRCNNVVKKCAWSAGVSISASLAHLSEGISYSIISFLPFQTVPYEFKSSDNGNHHSIPSTGEKQVL